MTMKPLYPDMSHTKKFSIGRYWSLGELHHEWLHVSQALLQNVVLRLSHSLNWLQHVRRRDLRLQR